jgi:hypothetical protein
MIGEKHLNEIRLENLRNKLVKVSQFPLFISDTARENFRLAKACHGRGDRSRLSADWFLERIGEGDAAWRPSARLSGFPGKTTWGSPAGNAECSP